MQKGGYMNFKYLPECACVCMTAISLNAIAATTVVQGTLYDQGGLVSDVNYWSLSVHSAGTVTIDTLSYEHDEDDFDMDGDYNDYIDVNGDGEIAFIDPYINLYIDDGSLDASDLIATNDDDFSNTYADGSIHGYDSYLSILLSAGDYILAIDACCGDPLLGYYYDGYPDWNGLQSETTNNHDHGDYQITFNGDLTVNSVTAELSKVPVPAAFWLFSSGIIGLVGVAGKRKHKY